MTITPRCPHRCRGGILDLGLGPDEHAACPTCGDEWPPDLADWNLTHPQAAALAIVVDTAPAKTYPSNRNDPTAAAAHAGSLAALEDADLVESVDTLTGWTYLPTDLGRLVASALAAEDVDR